MAAMGPPLRARAPVLLNSGSVASGLGALAGGPWGLRDHPLCAQFQCRNITRHATRSPVTPVFQTVACQACRCCIWQLLGLRVYHLRPLNWAQSRRWTMGECPTALIHHVILNPNPDPPPGMASPLNPGLLTRACQVRTHCNQCCFWHSMLSTAPSVYACWPGDREPSQPHSFPHPLILFCPLLSVCRHPVSDS